jgi:hypothetical protein
MRAEDDRTNSEKYCKNPKEEAFPVDDAPHNSSRLGAPRGIVRLIHRLSRGVEHAHVRRLLSR